MKKTNAVTKNSELTSVLNTHLQGKINLARLKLISHFIVVFILAIRNSLRNSKRLAATIITMALGVAIFSTGFNVRQSLWELLSGLQDELRYDVQVVLSKQISKKEAIAPFKSLQNIKIINCWNSGSGAVQPNLLSTSKGAGIVSLPYNTNLIKPKIIKGN